MNCCQFECMLLYVLILANKEYALVVLKNSGHFRECSKLK